MDAQKISARLFACLILLPVAASLGASYRTQNFVIEAPTAELAKEIGETAEVQRRELAIEWLGAEMRPWAQPCMLRAQVSPQLGAGGATSFVFNQGEVFGWNMTIQGSRERILDSVLPHEITHTVFATHFRRPLPRWADEGGCTTVEHPSERAKQEQMLITFLKTNRGISFSQMFAMKEYPADIMPLYSQGYSLARFLIEQGGKRKYLAFVGSGLDSEDWQAALRQHYGFENLLTLQNTWLDWVRRGSPALPQRPETAIAATSPRRAMPVSNPIYRAQSSDVPTAMMSVASGQDLRLAPVPKPAPKTVAATSTAKSDGWRPAGTSSVASSFEEKVSFEESAADAEPDSVYLQLARPQGAEKSKQIILDWGHSKSRSTTTQRPAREPLRDASLGEIRSFK